jgi:hypothetical protein
MPDLGWRLVEVLALQLTPADREAALGDLMETRTTAWCAIREITGLVARRQLQSLRDWPPWVAVFGLALPASFVLMGTSVSVSSTIQAMRWQVLAAHDVLKFLSVALLLASASWSAGFVVSSISRKTLWMSGVSCLLPCLFCFFRFRIESLPRLSLFLFIVPAVLGVWHGLRTMRISLGFATALAIVMTMWMIATRSSGFWLFDVALLWPPWYIVASVYRKAATKKSAAA